MDKICLDGDVYEPHTVKLTMNDDKNTAYFNYSKDHFWEFIESCIVAYKLVFGNPSKNSGQQLTAEDSQKMSHIIAKNLEETAKEIKLHQEFQKRFNIPTRSFDDIKAEHPLLSKKTKFLGGLDEH